MAAVDPLATTADAKRFDPTLGSRNNAGPKGARWWREIGWRYIVGLLGIVFALMPAYFVVLASVSPTATLQGAQLLPRR
jgi:arabinogalactan oligomer / maltooligosaccharide transport system permease protein